MTNRGYDRHYLLSVGSMPGIYFTLALTFKQRGKVVILPLLPRHQSLPQKQLAGLRFEPGFIWPQSLASYL